MWNRLYIFVKKYAENVIGYVFSLTFIIYGAYALLGNKVSTKTRGFIEISTSESLLLIIIGIVFLWYLVKDKDSE